MPVSNTFRTLLLSSAVALTACAHGATAPESQDPQAALEVEVSRLRRENAELRAKLRNAEERARLASAADVQREHETMGRRLPVVKLEPQGGEAGRRQRETVSISTPEAPEPEPEPPAFTAADMSGDPYVVERAPESAPPMPEAENGPKKYRLVGSRLVAETKKKRPKPKRKARGRKDTVVRDYDAAMASYKDGRFREAAVAFDMIARANPGHEYADNALYWKGEANYDEARYDAALEAFTEVVERYGGGNKAPDALLKIGLCYGRLGDVDNARDVLTQLIAAYPRAHATDLARAKLAEFPEGTS